MRRATRRAPDVFTRRPRRHLGVLKGNRNHGDTETGGPRQRHEVYRIHKKITSLGRSEEADVTIPDAMLADSHVHIHFDGREFNLATTEKDAEVFVNGKKKNRTSCSTRIGSASAAPRSSSRSTTSPSPKT